jgi:hypothetical protein
LGFATGLEVIGPVGADGGGGEVHFGPELAIGFLQSKPVRVAILPIDQEQVTAAIAVDIEDLDGFDGGGERNLLRLAEGVSPLRSARARQAMRFSEAMESMRKRASAGSSFNSRRPIALRRWTRLVLPVWL